MSQHTKCIVEIVLKEIETRFEDQYLHFNVFDPSTFPTSEAELITYGNDDITKIIGIMKRHAVTKTLKGYEFLENEKVIAPEWLKLKYLMKGVYDENGNNVQNLFKKILTEAKTLQIGTNIIQLLQIFMLLPLSTAACERGFSLRTNIKNSKRKNCKFLLLIH
eukprot:TRINITY_DN18005_c0_g1_i1.p2 TRINITY_DN18005_c0_g1~~TRINITY_DN18005_c0_g1_i1.p2  ORF type:complete len:163 (+),score=12.99 TRINITY_DN18005_c0_g1_i1:199-687(+)